MIRWKAGGLDGTVGDRIQHADDTIDQFSALNFSLNELRGLCNSLLSCSQSCGRLSCSARQLLIKWCQADLGSLNQQGASMRGQGCRSIKRT